MKDPNKYFTQEGRKEYNAHIHNIKAGLRFIANHWDDLSEGTEMDDHIDNELTVVYRLIDNHLDKDNE